MTKQKETKAYKTEMDICRQKAGARERYAIENGNKATFVDSRGHTMWRFTYSKYKPYQDANGALYDATEKRWVN